MTLIFFVVRVGLRTLIPVSADGCAALVHLAIEPEQAFDYYTFFSTLVNTLYNPILRLSYSR